MALYKGKIVKASPLTKTNIQIVNIIAITEAGDRPTSYYYSVDPDISYNHDDDIGLKMVVNYKKLAEGTASKEDIERYDGAHINLCKKLTEFDGEEIIYEKIYDQYGNLYAEEKMTGNVFPMVLKNIKYNVTYSSQNAPLVFFCPDKCQTYVYNPRKPELEANNGGSSIYLTGLENNEIYNLKLGGRADIDFGQQKHAVYLVRPTIYKVTIIPQITCDQVQRLEYVVVGNKVANQLEIDEYFDRFAKGLFKAKKRKNFMNSIKEKRLSNSYSEDLSFSLSNKMALLSECDITKEMQEISFELSKLKTISLEDYIKLYNEYHYLITGDDKAGTINNELKPEMLVELKKKIKLANDFHGGASGSILDYLSGKVKEYFDNYKNSISDKDQLTINELNKLCERILGSKNEYTYIEQNAILKYISMLYFFQLLENNYDLDDIENSYVLLNLKRIITIISTLNEEKIITDVPNDLFEVDSLEKLLSLIRKIKLVPREELKDDSNVLLKKLGQ